jgi:hypothetical protein
VLWTREGDPPTRVGRGEDERTMELQATARGDAHRREAEVTRRQPPKIQPEGKNNRVTVTVTVTGIVRLRGRSLVRSSYGLEHPEEAFSPNLRARPKPPSRSDER